jgi:hypothetical protein
VLLACAALGTAVAASGSEPATTPEIQTARKLFAEAQKDEQAQRWEDAVRKLQGVASIKQTAGVQYHIGNCLEHLSRLVQALESFQLAHSLADQNQVSDVLELVAPRIEALRIRIPTLTIRIRNGPAGATVQVDGKIIDHTLLGTPMAFDPGQHEIRVLFAGQAPLLRTVELIERQTESVEMDGARTAMPPSVHSGPSQGTVPIAPSSSAGLRPVPPRAWVAYAAGMSLALGGYLSFRRAGSVADDSRQVCASSIACDPARASTVHLWDGVALGMWVGALAATGLGVYWTVRREGARNPPSAAIVLTPGTVSLKAAF